MGILTKLKELKEEWKRVTSEADENYQNPDEREALLAEYGLDGDLKAEEDWKKQQANAMSRALKANVDEKSAAKSAAKKLETKGKATDKIKE